MSSRSLQKSRDSSEFASGDERRDVVVKLLSIPGLKEKIETFQTSKYVSVRALCASLGVPATEQFFRQKNVAGFLAENPNTESGYEIVINEGLPEVSKRWAMLHELCHWILEIKYPEQDGSNLIQLSKFKPRPLFFPFTEESYNEFEVQITSIERGPAGSRHYNFRLAYDFLANNLLGMKEERQANYLAGSIIMPKKHLLPDIERGYVPLSDVVNDYGVPKGYALKQLGFVRERLRRQVEASNN